MVRIFTMGGSPTGSRRVPPRGRAQRHHARHAYRPTLAAPRHDRTSARRRRICPRLAFIRAGDGALRPIRRSRRRSRCRRFAPLRPRQLVQERRSARPRGRPRARRVLSISAASVWQLERALRAAHDERGRVYRSADRRHEDGGDLGRRRPARGAARGRIVEPREGPPSPTPPAPSVSPKICLGAAIGASAPQPGWRRRARASSMCSIPAMPLTTRSTSEAIPASSRGACDGALEHERRREGRRHRLSGPMNADAVAGDDWRDFFAPPLVRRSSGSSTRNAAPSTSSSRPAGRRTPSTCAPGRRACRTRGADLAHRLAAAPVRIALARASRRDVGAAHRVRRRRSTVTGR